MKGKMAKKNVSKTSNRPLSTPGIVSATLDPTKRNIGSVGIALVAAARLAK